MCKRNSPNTRLARGKGADQDKGWHLTYAWGELHPAGYRLMNVAIHFLSAVLLMLIVRRTLRMEHFAGRFDRAAGPLALLVALVCQT